MMTDILTADDIEHYVAAQGITNPTMKLMSIIPLISAAHDKKILIDDTYLLKIKNSLNDCSNNSMINGGKA